LLFDRRRFLPVVTCSSFAGEIGAEVIKVQEETI
jgi:hypothetical protein